MREVARKRGPKKVRRRKQKYSGPTVPIHITVPYEYGYILKKKKREKKVNISAFFRMLLEENKDKFYEIMSLS